MGVYWDSNNSSLYPFIYLFLSLSPSLPVFLPNVVSARRLGQALPSPVAVRSKKTFTLLSFQCTFRRETLFGERTSLSRPLSLFLSLGLSLCGILSLHLSASIHLYLSTHLFLCVATWLSVCFSVRLSSSFLCVSRPFLFLPPALPLYFSFILIFSPSPSPSFPLSRTFPSSFLFLPATLHCFPFSESFPPFRAAAATFTGLRAS